MRLVRSIAICIVLAATSSASAQTPVVASPERPAAPPERALRESPVGHRQPRASAVTPPQDRPETSQDANAREDAALDRAIKGICRGC